MLKNCLLFSFTLLSFFLNAQSSEYFYFGPDGREPLELSLQQIVIQFEEEIPLAQQQQILSAEKSIIPLTAAKLLPSPKVTIAELTGINSSTDLHLLLEQLQSTPRIRSAYPFFNYSDGTKMALQSKLLIRLRNENDFPLLENVALRNQLKIEANNAFEPLLFHVTLLDTSADPLKVAQELYTSNLFDYVEPDFLRFMKPMTTNDPAFPAQWSIENSGQNNGISGADMNVTEAWLTTTGKPTVKVAIIDEGVDLNHPDLMGNLLPGYDATEQNSGGAPSGNDAHGTACAGIVAAVGNNNLGMAGVAYDSKIVPIRLAYNQDDAWVTSSAWVSNAINWAWREGEADVLSNSWGGGGSSFSINNAIDNALKLGRNGLGSPVLFAAGNEDTEVSYPGDYEVTIAVGAMSMCYERKSPTSCDNETWWGSNYGTHLDVIAPGTRIYTTDISGGAGYSGTDYATYFNGTSSATPNAAGVIALIIAANENLTGEQARYALESTCRKVGDYNYENGVVGQPTGSWNNEMGYGLVNAGAAIQSVVPSRNDDAGIKEILRPVNTICGSAITPTVNLRNNGSNNLTNVIINTRISNGEIYTYNWNGNLASTATVEVTLSEIPVAAGAHDLEIFTSRPNGNADSNDDNNRAFAKFSIGQEEFLLTVTLDNYGSETSWALKNNADETLLNGGPYENNAVGRKIEEKFCLPDGCYKLVFYDEYDDGMCCGYGDGGYELTQVSNREILINGGQYTNEIVHDICVEGIGEVQEIEALTVVINEVQNVNCNGQNDGTASATVAGGTPPYSYQWSNGTTTKTTNNLNAGEHQISIKDAGGQAISGAVTITEPASLLISLSSSSATDNENGTAQTTINGGVTPYSIRWSNGATTAAIENLAIGNYTVTVADQNGCTTTKSVTVENNETPALTISLTDIQSLKCFDDTNGSATVEVVGGDAPYTYSWSNEATTATVNNLLFGQFAVVVSDSRGRTAQASGIIESPAPLNLNTSSTKAIDNENGSANISVNGGTTPYRYRWSNAGTSATISSLNAGTYTVTVTDQNNCQATKSIVVENEATPEVTPTVLFENGKIESLTESWKIVELENNYESMVVVASVRLANTSSVPAITRIRNATGNQFQIRLQNPGGTITEALTVDYFVIEEGVYNKEEHGIKMEAVRKTSTRTASRDSWTRERQTYQNSYDSPVVLGQVMTHNDERWSIFWASHRTQRDAPPSRTSFAAGKHVGEDTVKTRTNETIGYVVFESGIQQINETKLYTALGADNIRGVSNTTSGFFYDVDGLIGATTGLVSAAGMDSNNGGWPSLLGDNAVKRDEIRLVIDEDQIRDAERAHTTEQAAYVVFEDKNVEEKEVTPLQFEYGELSAVNNQFQQVQLENTYESMVVIATVIMDNKERLPALTRIREAEGASFSIKIQNPSEQESGSYKVQYFVVEEGIYNQTDHGVKMEAVKTLSTKTSARSQWEYERRIYQNNYSQPVVIGQVMTYNDERWSSFWANNGNRKNAPTSSLLSVGKHVGEDPVKQRADETLGYVVFESENGEINGINFTAGLGADRIYGIHNSNSGYRYGIEGVTAESIAVLSSSGMDGSDCGWPVLYGDNPVDNNQIITVIEEDMISDEERFHSSEQVAYVVFNTAGASGFTIANIENDESNIIQEAIDLPFTAVAYPNPTTDLLTLKMSQILVGKTQLQMFDLNGRLLDKQTIELDPKGAQWIILNVQNLADGQYIIRLANDLQTFTIPFIKLN